MTSTSGRREYVRLQDIAEEVTVGHVGSTTEYYRDQGVPFLRTQNVGDRCIILKDLRFVDQEFHGRLAKSSLACGDVVLSRVVSDRVNCAVIPKELHGSNCANVIKVRPGKLLDSRYLLHYLSNPELQSSLMQRQVGSAQAVVNTAVLKQCSVPVVPLAEQRRIAAILDKADATRRKREEGIRLTEELLRSTFLEMFGDPETNPKE